MQQHVDESILNKIRAAQSLAEGAKTEAEAAAAMAAVERLCAKHNLEIGSVKIQQEETDASVREWLKAGAYQAYWTYLALSCKEMFQVGWYKQPQQVPVILDGLCLGSTNGSKVVFYGLKANVESAQMTFGYLYASVDAMLQGWIYEGNKVDNTTARSFKIGCGKRIFDEVKKLHEQVKAHLEANPQAAAETQAIVLIGNQLMKKHEEKLNLRKTKSAGARDGNAYSAGYAAGGRVDLHGAKSSRMLA